MHPRFFHRLWFLTIIIIIMLYIPDKTRPIKILSGIYCMGDSAHEQTEFPRIWGIRSTLVNLYKMKAPRVLMPDGGAKATYHKLNSVYTHRIFHEHFLH